MVAISVQQELHLANCFKLKHSLDVVALCSSCHGNQPFYPEACCKRQWQSSKWSLILPFSAREMRNWPERHQCSPIFSRQFQLQLSFLVNLIIQYVTCIFFFHLASCSVISTIHHAKFHRQFGGAFPARPGAWPANLGTRQDVVFLAPECSARQKLYGYFWGAQNLG